VGKRKNSDGAETKQDEHMQVRGAEGVKEKSDGVWSLNVP
jgi:hypothetical protein